MSNKLWQGVTAGKTNAAADAFNSSISFDSRMYKEDITGSIAHARMLAKCGIIEPEEADAICGGLSAILADIESGALAIDQGAEDIHMFVEATLTERIGEVGKKLHTARSRNDQVALDLRMHLRGEIDEITALTKKLASVVCDQAEKNVDAIMPGYTHLQRAQPVTFGHHLMAYAAMLLRDIDRLADCRRRLNVSPIGSCALAGTTYATDRRFEADALGFDGVMGNSMDGVSDRDYALELMSDLAIMMTHLSRFAEEIILWSSWEYRFVKLSDEYTTGSSIMPQKKNPDMAELVRGKTGRVFGDMTGFFATMKGLPLAYNKDMQEDKEPVFDACDTAKACLGIFAGMIETMTACRENMLRAAQTGFINATDYADYLVGKGLPFRSAYKIAGETVALCTDEGFVLETLPLEKYRSVCDLVDEGVYDAVDLKNCVERRISEGGTAPASVRSQIAAARARLQS